MSERSARPAVAGPEAGPGSPRGWALLALLAGPFMSMVDSSAINVAVPEIVAETGRPLTLVGWVVSAYLLGIAAALPVTTALAARFGVVRVYVAAVGIFGVTSLLCGLAPGVPTLIAARALQGVGAAALVPLALALLFAREAPDPVAAAEAGAAVPEAAESAWKGSPVAGLLLFLAPALGPSLGAAVMQTPAGWRGIFFLNLPVAAVALLAARRLPVTARDGGESADRGIDPVALVLLGGGCVTLTLGASFIGDSAAGRLVPGVVLAAVGVALGVAWAARVRRHRCGDLAPFILASPRHRAGVVVSLVASVVLFGVLFLVPVFFVGAAGWSLLTAGLVLLPQGVMMGLAHPLGEALKERCGLRTTVVAGLSVLAGSSLLLLALDETTPAWVVALVLMVRGIALGLTLQPMIVGLMTTTPYDQVTGVSSLFTISQRVGASVGIALIAAFYHARAGSGAVEAFHSTALLLSAACVVGVVFALFLPSPRPADQATLHTA